MAKIKGWKKVNDSTYISDDGTKILQIVDYRGNGLYQVFVSHSGGIFGNVYGESFTTKKKAKEKAIEYMRKNNKVKTMVHIGEDRWGREVWEDENNRTWKKVGGVYHSVSKDGEPSSPISKNVTIFEVKKGD